MRQTLQNAVGYGLLLVMLGIAVYSLGSLLLTLNVGNPIQAVEKAARMK